MKQVSNVNTTDRKFLEETVKISENASNNGNYPVGAVLVIDGEAIAHQENEVVTKKSWAKHAESQLIIDNGAKLKEASEKGLEIVLYSSLEPCLMCLGTATINKVSKIIYIQKDPHGGACDLDIRSLGKRYPEIIPETIEARISETPKTLIIKFLEQQLISGNKKWAEKSLPLFLEV